jgi:hypothetical protein
MYQVLLVIVFVYFIFSYVQSIWKRSREVFQKQTLSKQSISVSMEDNKTHDTVRRSLKCQKGILDKPHNSNVDYATTLYDSFQHSVEKYGEFECLGHRRNGDGEYVWKSYNTVNTLATNFGSGLISLTNLKRQGLVGIFSNNCEEWVICEKGCNAYSFVTVPLYQTLGNESIIHIIE